MKKMNKSKIKNKISGLILNSKKSFNLLWTMVSRNVKTMYRGSVLGAIWTVLNPLLTMFILSFVYSQIFGRAMEGIKYPVYVLSGMILYNTFFRGATVNGLGSIVSRRALVMQTQIPITIYPRVEVYTALVNFLFSLIALVVVMLIYGQAFHWTLVFIIVLIISMLLLSHGVAYVMSVVFVYFRDIKNIYNVLVTMLMYATPLFYTVESLNNPLFTQLVKFNPMFYYVDYFRQIIIGNIPSLGYHLMILGLGLFAYAFGYMFIIHNKKKFIFYM